MNENEARKILGVNENAQWLQIRSAFLGLALKFHPDKKKAFSDLDQGPFYDFRDIHKAYKLLRNTHDVPRLKLLEQFHRGEAFGRSYHLKKANLQQIDAEWYLYGCRCGSDIPILIDFLTLQGAARLITSSIWETMINSDESCTAEEICPQSEDTAEVSTKARPADRKGVIYISRVPPLMSVIKLRQIMSKYGAIGRIYLNPEDPAHRQSRLRRGGSKRKLFLDGWIEFEDKKEAKATAQLLNGCCIGGPKRHNHWRDDLWNLRYLPKFKWHNLLEFLTLRKREREHRKHAEIIETKREVKFYLEQRKKKQHQDFVREKKQERQHKRESRKLHGVCE